MSLFSAHYFFAAVKMQKRISFGMKMQMGLRIRRKKEKS